MTFSAVKFQKVTHTFQRRLLNVALREANELSQAEDWVQETFLRAWQDFESLENDKLVYPWLLKILTRVCIDDRRKESRRSALAPIINTDDAALHSHRCSAPGPFEALIANRTNKQLEDSIRSLPEDFRLVILLRDIEGMSYQDIAYILDIPKGTVMSRLSRGRRILAKFILESEECNNDQTKKK